MIKKYLHILLVIAIMLLACEYAFAASDFDKPDFSTTPGGSEIGKLVGNINDMAKTIYLIQPIFFLCTVKLPMLVLTLF